MLWALSNSYLETVLFHLLSKTSFFPFPNIVFIQISVKYPVLHKTSTREI
jgi:hypothetical protein